MTEASPARANMGYIGAIVAVATIGGFLFGYDKLLGAKAPTAADLKNVQDGKETSVDRTRRLFYVTCSRAKSSLALVAYSADPAAVRAHVVANEWFEADEVLSELP